MRDTKDGLQVWSIEKRSKNETIRVDHVAKRGKIHSLQMPEGQFIAGKVSCVQTVEHSPFLLHCDSTFHIELMAFYYILSLEYHRKKSSIIVVEDIF